MNYTVYLNKIPFLRHNGKSYEDILESVFNLTNLTKEDYYLLYNGKLLTNTTEFSTRINFDTEISLKVNGGKGGFGSMLRAIGAQIEKTTNKEACRDLSGRRLRDINEEKKLKAWLEKQKEREEEAKERKKRKLERLIAVPKHEFKDINYENARSELTEKISEAVEEGFKKAENSIAKRKAETITTKRKPNLWFDDDLSSGSDSDSESETECKKLKMSTELETYHDNNSAEVSNSSKHILNESSSNSNTFDSGLNTNETSCSSSDVQKRDVLTIPN
ncbi:splicing regulator SDE2 [Condylostylus longicornis]|uniref:splicing regulator SDE2 n=1 Tax=Condylostylus longicornis TaxID=2530218 RepID=UPI00244E481A|nr:splicing regulator SDE2 [Condylostylus longicornis]